MAYLSNAELENRGDMLYLVRVKQSEDECNVCVIAWMEQDRRHFIALGSSMAEGGIP